MINPLFVAAFRHAFGLTDKRTFGVLEIPASENATMDDARAAFQRAHGDELQRLQLSESNGTLSLVLPNMTFAWGFLHESCNSYDACKNFSYVTLPRDGGQVHTVTPCRDAEELKRRAYRRETYEQWAEQTHKVYLCGRLITAWETKHRRRFDYVMKWRADAIPLRRYPPLRHFDPKFIHVNKMTWDFWFICAREKCQGLLEDGPSLQRSCSLPNFGFTDKMSKILSQGYDSSDVHEHQDSGDAVRLAIHRSGCCNFQFQMPPTGRKTKVFGEALRKLNATNREWFDREIGRIVNMKVR
jgi:hypothetical protein